MMYYYNKQVGFIVYFLLYDFIKVINFPLIAWMEIDAVLYEVEKRKG